MKNNQKFKQTIQDLGIDIPQQFFSLLNQSQKLKEQNCPKNFRVRNLQDKNQASTCNLNQNQLNNIISPTNITTLQKCQSLPKSLFTRPLSHQQYFAYDKIQQDYIPMPNSCCLDQNKTQYNQISIQTIKQITGMNENLFQQIKKIQFRFDFEQGNIFNLHELLPNLLQLRISDSNLSNLREMGSRLKKLEILWVCRCRLIDLDGISMFPNLKQLYANFNQIKTILSLLNNQTLQLLDLQQNLLTQLEQINTLNSMTELKYLFIKYNPISKHKDFNKQIQVLLNKNIQIDQGQQKVVKSKYNYNNIDIKDEIRQSLVFDQFIIRELEVPQQDLIEQITTILQQNSVHQQEEEIICKSIIRKKQKQKQNKQIYQYNPFSFLDQALGVNPCIIMFQKNQNYQSNNLEYCGPIVNNLKNRRKAEILQLNQCDIYQLLDKYNNFSNNQQEIFELKKQLDNIKIKNKSKSIFKILKAQNQQIKSKADCQQQNNFKQKYLQKSKTQLSFVNKNMFTKKRSYLLNHIRQNKQQCRQQQIKQNDTQQYGFNKFKNNKIKLSNVKSMKLFNKK